MLPIEALDLNTDLNDLDSLLLGVLFADFSISDFALDDAVDDDKRDIKSDTLVFRLGNDDFLVEELRVVTFDGLGGVVVELPLLSSNPLDISFEYRLSKKYIYSI